MIGARNSLNLNCKVRVMKEAPGPSVSEEIADIFPNYDIDDVFYRWGGGSKIWYPHYNLFLYNCK